MFSRFLRPARREEGIPAVLYGAIVAQARQPAFYRDHAVPDTVDGRFDMIVLHAFLLFRRLEAEGQTGAALRQEVFDLFFLDMDRSLREMGVGDLTVPKRVRRMAESFYGRLAAYGEALATGNRPGLVAALGRNLFPAEAEAEPPAGAAAIARYVLAADADLAGQPGRALLAGRVTFPDPEALDVGAPALQERP